MPNFSIDTYQRQVGSRACAILHYKIDSTHWLYTEDKTYENGTLCTLELSENGRWFGKKIEGIIKGTKLPKDLKYSDAIRYSLDTNTIERALSSQNTFLLFYVDVNTENVYYLPLQEYFINQEDLFDKLGGEQGKINVHIPKSNILTEDDSKLVELSRYTYAGGPGKSLRRHERYEQLMLINL